MKRLQLLIILLVTFVASAFIVQQNHKITIYMIGDSTMSNKKNPDRNPERGWGQMLQQYFNDDVLVSNHAVSGRSTRSFIDEGRWDKVVNLLQPGDYVFIQFGHNDQKEYDPKRYTNPYSGYRHNLEKFVNETKAKGAHPVLLSSIVRRNFNDEGTLVDTHGPYPFVTRTVAHEMEVPFIDLQLKTEKLVIELGFEKSMDIYLFLEPNEVEMYPDGKEDNTHLSIEGATKVAGLAVEGIKELNLPLVKYIR